MKSTILNIGTKLSALHTSFSPKVSTRQIHSTKSTKVYQVAQSAMEEQLKPNKQIPILEKSSTKQTKRNKKVQSEKVFEKKSIGRINKQPLSFEEYVKENLLSYEEYKQKLTDSVVNYSSNPEEIKDIDRIKKAYRIYCKSAYNGYVMSLNSYNPFCML